MTSRVSWSVDGIEPSVRERAEAAARRAGMSLGDWLNSTIGTPNDAHDVADIHRRLDSISRQMENISRAPNGAKSDPGVARQLNDAISRLALANFRADFSVFLSPVSVDCRTSNAAADGFLHR